MPRPLRAGFTGYYGMSNFGDDLFGALCATAAREFWGAEPCLVGPVIPGVDSRTTMPRWYPASLYGATGAVGKAGRLYSFLRGVGGNDVLAMGGGSVINARESFRKPLMLRAQRRGLKLAAVGVSIGPFPDAASEDAAAAFVECFDYISVRDRRSYEWAVRMGLDEKVHAGRDLAGLLPPPDARDGDRSDAIVVGIAPCQYSTKDYPAPAIEAWQTALVEALAQIAASRPISADIFSLNEHAAHGDRALADALQQRLAERGIEARRVSYEGRGPDDIVRAIARCDAMVSARLHGAIVAYMQEIPFAIVDYHPKCRDFAQDVGLPAERLIAADRHGVEAFAEAFASMLESKRQPGVSRAVYAEQARGIFQCAPWSSSATT